MKITNVKVSIVKYTLPTRKLYEGASRSSSKVKFIIVKIAVDRELFGLGEVYYKGQDVYYLEDLLNNMLKGKDPCDIEVITRTMKGQFDVFDEMVLGAISVALWDILGKLSNMSIAKLLGVCRDKIKAYLSMSCLLTAKPLEERIEEIDGYISQGFKAIKLRIGSQDIRKVLFYIGKIKEELGDKIEIAVDANQDAAVGDDVWSYDNALMMARELGKMGVIFFEEPLMTRRYVELCDLTREAPLPTAGGEKEAQLFGFKEIIKRNVYDIVQPDVVMSGGISAVKKIADMADLYGKLCIPHSWCHGIGLAATLQVIGSIENCKYVEFPFDEAWAIEYRDIVLNEVIKINNEGYVKIPSGSGIGVSVKDEIVEKIDKGLKLIEVG